MLTHEYSAASNVHLRRSNVLERFAVMNTQLHSISGQMVPLMEHYIVHPKVRSFLCAKAASFKSLLSRPLSGTGSESMAICRLLISRWPQV